MKSYTSITARYLKGQIKRTVLTIFGIILSVALITSIGTIIVSMREQLIKDAVKDNGDYYAMFENLDNETAYRVKNHVEADKACVSRTEGYAPIYSIPAQERAEYEDAPPYRYLSVKSYDSNAMKMLPLILKEGRLPNAPDEIAMDYWTLESLAGKPQLGDRIKLQIGTRSVPATGKIFDDKSWSKDEIFNISATKEYRIVGLLTEQIISPKAFIAKAVTFLDSNSLKTGETYNVYVKTSSPANARERIKKIITDTGIKKIDKNGTQDYPVIYNERVLRLSAQSVDAVLNQSMKYILLFIVALIMISTVAVIYNAFHISVLERISQLGILRCTGATPRQIKMLVFREAAILSAFGIPIGLACGVFAMQVVMKIISTLRFGMVDIFNEFEVTVSAPVMVLSTILGLVTVFLSAYGPARQASKVSALEAVKNAGAFKTENFSGFKKKTFSRHFLGIEGQIAVKNLGRNRKRFRITVFSMAVSIVLYIIFGTFVNYIFGIGAIYQNVDIDFLLHANVNTENKSIKPETINQIKSLPGVAMVYLNMRNSITALIPDSRINPRFAEVKGEALKNRADGKTELKNSAILTYGDEALSDLKDYLKAGTADKNILDTENGVVLLAVNRFYSSKIKKSIVVDAVNYSVGDELEIAVDSPNSKDGRKYQEVKIIGILEKGIIGEEYVPDGGIYLFTSQKVFENICGRNEAGELAIRLKKDAKKGPVSDYLTQLSRDNRAYIFEDITQMNKDLQSIAIIMSIFLYGFVGVITLIGCLNIINTISTNLLLRTRELSVLKAVGMTKGGIKRMVSLEGVLYGVIASFFGGIIGTVLSRLLYNIIISVREIPWTVPWKQIITGIFGALIITLLSSYIPLRRINKGSIIENIRMEA